ncbi:MAG: hypothetical protein B7Y08_11155 [Rhodospirillales bacterium 24-66-33]|nr:MAG: hypothetical protein B7Y57_08275 [Rhodospirillales bacterium 35-66-84]OYZ94828.1 MAG: hypothetical protein B7Y08_11155 [Rhodospirillales bacterium 24-66-33]OZB26097.1 MAG: hypothetical protein B7X63_09055 [Rhodospirillales bacterium 39-66-50]
MIHDGEGQVAQSHGFVLTGAGQVIEPKTQQIAPLQQSRFQATLRVALQHMLFTRQYQAIQPSILLGAHLVEAFIVNEIGELAEAEKQPVDRLLILRNAKNLVGFGLPGDAVERQRGR